MSANGVRHENLNDWFDSDSISGSDISNKLKSKNKCLMNLRLYYSQ